MTMLSPIKKAWIAAEQDEDDLPDVTPGVIAIELRDLAVELQRLEEAQLRAAHHADWVRRFVFSRDRVVDWPRYPWLFDQAIRDLLERVAAVTEPVVNGDGSICSELAELIGGDAS